jgi:hypothetical protein
MFASDLKALQESYQGIYEEGDGISCEMIEEVVEELIQECVEFGYTLDEASVAVENAAILYLDEAKVTYGSDTESPEQRKARAKERLGGMKSSARKAAVKTAVGRVQAKARGVKAVAGIAASIAKDEARRAGRAATHAVSSTVQKKKAEVKGGIKRMIGGGLRAAATGIGKVAQKAAGAASRLGEEYVDEAITSEKGKAKAAAMIAARSTPSGRAKPGQGASVAAIKHISRANVENLSGTPATPTIAKNPVKSRSYGGTGNKAARRAAALKNEEFDIFDLVLEYLLETGHAETISEAQYIMSQMDSNTIEEIVEAQEARNNPEKYEREQAKKSAPVRGERTPMPPRGDKRREDFEKWYAANVR